MKRPLLYRFLPLLTAVLLQTGSSKAQSVFTLSELDSLGQHARNRGFQGTILIIQGEKTLFQQHYGVANVNTGAPITGSTRFNIGSIGKSLTGLLVLQQVAAGRLSLDRPVAEYLPASDSFPNSRSISARQLLSHTAGLGDFFDSPAYDPQRTRSTADHFRLVQQLKPLRDRPGLDYGYSNAGFIVLGQLLEHQTGSSYARLLDERLLRPAGVQRAAKAPRATGYRNDKGAWVEGEGNDPSYFSAAGGLFLSAGELHRIVRRVVRNGYLSQAWRDTMWKPAVHPAGEPPFVNYGLGWMVESPMGLELRGHNGGVRGFQAAFRYLPQHDLYIYVLSNRENGAEETFMEMVMLLAARQAGASGKPRP